MNGMPHYDEQNVEGGSFSSRAPKAARRAPGNANASASRADSGVRPQSSNPRSTREVCPRPPFDPQIKRSQAAGTIERAKCARKLPVYGQSWNSATVFTRLLDVSFVQSTTRASLKFLPRRTERPYKLERERDCVHGNSTALPIFVRPPHALLASPTSPASSTSLSEYSSGSMDSWSQSSKTSTRSSPVHAASLVDPATHAPALMQLIDIKLDKHVIGYVVDCVAETVDYAMGRTHSTASLPSTVTRGRSMHCYLQKFTSFVSTVLARAEVTPATVLVALVYISRARPHLSIATEKWVLERVFLGAVIVASKYTNDSTLKNVHWALCTGVFGKRDIGRIEREFLDVLDWELGVGEADLLAHHEGLLAASKRSNALASRRVKTKPAKPKYPAPPRAHTYTRRPSAGAVVPELEPSSPRSSLASMSPRTPLSHFSSPAADRMRVACTQPSRTQRDGPRGACRGPPTCRAPGNASTARVESGSESTAHIPGSARKASPRPPLQCTGQAKIGQRMRMRLRARLGGGVMSMCTRAPNARKGLG
ncbi:hypothetical protein B0H19DRAFT_1384303 [Mycena capillaripes]|nr:hypothetical protein B0H19DRAFT_1384303 [Mycena capillaripes]